MVKRYAAEAIGTFMIVFAPVAFASNGGDATLLSAALVSGLPVLAMVYALGPISAAHFNPAVTLGFAVAKRFPWRYVPAYWLSQVIGSIAAALTAFVIFGHSGGAHTPADPTALAKNVGIEAAITAFLMLTIISVATDKRVSSTIPGIAIGLAVVVGVLVGGPVTGGSMNPARSLGPALLTGGQALTNYWIYIIGPCIGAVIGAVAFEAIRLEPEHAVGVPNELLEALREIEHR